MGGPAASVLLRKRLSDADHASLRILIDEVSDHDMEPHPAPDAFWVSSTRSIGGSYRGEGRPFGLSTGLQPEWEPEQLPQVAPAFGFIPVDEILLVAFCNGDEDHRILGELCVHLVEQFEGVMSFGGALCPIAVPDGEIDMYEDWQEAEPRFRRLVEGMPGFVVGLRYEPQPGREWVTHVADAAFARAWLSHPLFRMVK